MLSIVGSSASEFASAAPTTKKLSHQDHVRAVVEDKDPYALWLLIARAGIVKIGRGNATRDVNIQLARDLIHEWSQTDDYQAAAKEFLEEFHLPRDRTAENLKLIQEFKESHPSAIVVETRFYHILSTCNRNITKELASRMDAIFTHYDRLFNFEEKIPYKCVIEFLKDQNEYLATNPPPDTVAYFSPLTKKLVGYNTRTNPDTTHVDPYENMFHEGWHQYFDFYIPGSPRWFDEGFAQVFQTTDVGGRQAKQRRNPQTAEYASYLLQKGRLIPLRQLIRMDHAQFMASADVTYPESYSFVTFLLHYRDGNKAVENRIRGFYKNYFWELRKGTEPVEAADLDFKDVSLDKLEELWKRSIQRQR